MAGHDVDLVDLDLALQPHRDSLGGQAAAELLGHGLHIRPVEAQLPGDLTGGEVQAHEGQAQQAPRAAAAGDARPARCR